jgi:hypothetical protein
MATPLQPQNQGFPQVSAPVVDGTGVITEAWYKFFISLWVRSGGSQGQPGPYIPSDVIITGGTIDGVAIGSTVPDTGQFTTLHATGTVTGSNFTGSSSGVNTGNVSLSGDNYITISGQTITAHNVALATQVSGNLPVTNLNSGTAASSTTFWRGDTSWVNPLAGGISTTITTAKLTGAGANGSMVFTNGLLTASTPAT